MKCLRSFFRWLLITNWLAEFLRTPLVAIATPPITAAYLSARELLYDDWAIFNQHPVVHNWLTALCLAAIVAVGVVKAIASLYQERATERFISLLNSLLFVNGRIVDAKLERFKDYASGKKDGDSTFLSVTQPHDQVKVICREIQHYLNSSHGIPNTEDIRITIVAKSPLERDGHWHFYHDTQPNLQPGDKGEAEEVVAEGRVANACLSTGEPQFIPDKELAARLGDYQLSERDARKGNGSLYCYPCVVRMDGQSSEFAISITTYNNQHIERLFYRDSTDRAKLMLWELCKRIELELTLQCIKWLEINQLRGSCE